MGIDARSALHLTAFELADRLAGGEFDVRAVVAQAIRRVEEVTARHGAMAAGRFEEAMLEAERLDRLRAEGERSLPLMGVPFVVSECIAVAGMPHSAGRKALATHRAARDASVVQRLRDAGAVCIGVANVAEAGFGIDTRNAVYGQTSSPWNVGRAAGGSCGGVAALVSTAAVPFGIGADIHGDSRLAGHFCGVLAHKGTGGLVPSTGLEPAPRGKARRYVSLAPIARAPSDLFGLLRIVAGPDGSDRAVTPYVLRDPAELNFTWKRVVRCADPGPAGLFVSPSVHQAVDRAARALAGRGAEVEDWRPDQLSDADEIWLAMHHEANGLHASFADQLLEGASGSLLGELPRALLGRSTHTLQALAFATVGQLTRSSYVRIQRLCAKGRRLRERLNTVLGDGGVMIAPAWPSAVPEHRRALRRPRAFIPAAVFNVLEVPVTVVPVGLDEQGLPLAVQVIAAQGRDDACLAAAAVIHEYCGPIGFPPA